MITKRINFRYPAGVADQPVISRMVRDYDIEINIFRAQVNQNEEGFMILDLTGKEKDINKGLEYLRSFNIEINDSDLGLQWNREKCTSCGNCLTHCPTDALYIPDRKTMEVEYRADRCIDCMNCIKHCPFGACTSLI